MPPADARDIADSRCAHCTVRLLGQGGKAVYVSDPNGEGVPADHAGLEAVLGQVIGQNGSVVVRMPELVFLHNCLPSSKPVPRLSAGHWRPFSTYSTIGSGPSQQGVGRMNS